MNTDTAEMESCRTSTEAGPEGPAVNWDRKNFRTNRSPMNPTIVQGNRYVATRHNWAYGRRLGSARQSQ